MLNIIGDIIMTVLGYLKADWYILLIGILLAVCINVYVDTNKLKKFLERKAGLSVPGAVAFGALTPLCACGTMAVLISMFVSAMPWGPVMAFLISSPLTSPSEFMFETAFFGSKFAIAMLVASIILGILAGFLAHFLDKKTNFFKGQFRMGKTKATSCCGEKSLSNSSCCESKSMNTSSCCGEKKITTQGPYFNEENVTTQGLCSCEEKVVNRNVCSCEEGFAVQKSYFGEENIAAQCSCCSEEKAVIKVKGCCKSNMPTFIQKYKLDKLAKEFINIGLKKVLLYFVIFISIGRVVEMIIPKEWIMSLFGENRSYSVPLAATIGLPLYLNSSSALPLLRIFINSGAGQGAVLAFLIAGKATGAPVIAGMSTFLKKRAMLYYVGFIYIGAIIAGYVAQYFIG